MKGYREYYRATGERKDSPDIDYDPATAIHKGQTEAEIKADAKGEPPINYKPQPMSESRKEVLKAMGLAHHIPKGAK